MDTQPQPTIAPFEQTTLPETISETGRRILWIVGVYRAVCGNHIDAAEVARQAKVKTLVLTHMLEQIDQPGIRERIIKEITEVFDGNVIWGEDLMEIPVKGPALHKME